MTGICRRVLRWFARSGLLDVHDARDMLGWDNAGFSLDAAVRIAGHDGAGLERLLRYCAGRPLALERLAQVNEYQAIRQLPKAQRDGRRALSLNPLELLDHLAVLNPPPRLCRYRDDGVLAPNSPLRAAVTPYGHDAPRDSSEEPPVAASVAAAMPTWRSPPRYPWAMPLARLFESLPLTCPNRGADMRIVAFVTEAAPQPSG